MTDADDQAATPDRPTSGRSGRRRSSSPTVNTIYWRDIPAQLTARGADENAKVMLHDRFQHAIDRAAGLAGLTSTDDYVQEWRTVSAPLPNGNVGAQLDQLCAEIEATYTPKRLEGIVAAGGVDLDLPTTNTTPIDATPIETESE